MVWCGGGGGLKDAFEVDMDLDNALLGVIIE